MGSETVYTYLDGNHKHAVTHLGGVQKHWYDANGNMTTRVAGATTYTQGWDAENRLVTVSGAGLSSTFGYDGDGVRVKGTVNGTVTAYVGSWFEWIGSTSTMKKYYYWGSQRIAMRTGSGTGTSGLLWMIGDHLGSTTKIANYDGTINSQRRYRPWGEWRFGVTLPTTFAFTGQRQEVQLGGADGLYYYGARWYDAALGRWVSPDSIIPEAAQGVQAWSRYTYVNNAPTRYRDPTGHSVDCGVAKLGCEAGEYNPHPAQEIPDPSIVLPTARDIVDFLVPDSGTGGGGISLTVGAAIDLNLSFGLYVDSSGDAGIGFSVGGGGLLPGAAEVAAFYSSTNAETVNQLKGWSMTLGGSIEADGSVGGDRVWFSDKSTGKKFNGYSVTVGLGAAAPVPAEVHVGVNHMWLTPTLNLYDIWGLSRP